MLRMATGHWW